MPFGSPSSDDRAMWDVWLSYVWLPGVSVADELGIFRSLAEKPASADELAAALGVTVRGLRALLPLLSSLGYLVPRSGKYHVTDAGRDYLLPSSPYYWGGVLDLIRKTHVHHAALRTAMTERGGLVLSADNKLVRPAEAWEKGKLTVDMAQVISRFMHSHSMVAAQGCARHGNFAGVSKLLDIGGGSGCFSVAFAQAHPQLHCAIMELAEMCPLAEEYIRAAGVSNRVTTLTVDMFRQPWPKGFDALFFSNVFHDWSMETCTELARKAYAALPTGGRIYLHEMLLADDGSGPRTAAAFSVVMLLGTQGQQFSYADLSTLLTEVGFSDPSVTSTSFYYSLVCAVKR